MMPKLLENIINGALRFLEVRINRATKSIVSAILSKGEGAQTQVLVRAVSRFEKLAEQIKSPSFNVSIDVDELKTELAQIKDEMRSVTMPDLENIEVALGRMLLSLDNVKPQDIKEELRQLAEAINKIQTYDTVKINDTQLRSLRSGGLGLGGSPIQTAKNRTLANTAMATANTEYSYTFPANTISWKVRVRQEDVPLLVAFDTGTLPTSGDGSAYFTIMAYYIEENNGLDWGGKTIYLQTGSDSQTAEIISYQL